MQIFCVENTPKSKKKKKRSEKDPFFTMPVQGMLLPNCWNCWSHPGTMLKVPSLILSALQSSMPTTLSNQQFIFFVFTEKSENKLCENMENHRKLAFLSEEGNPALANNRQSSLQNVKKQKKEKKRDTFIFFPRFLFAS